MRGRTAIQSVPAELKGVEKIGVQSKYKGLDVGGAATSLRPRGGLREGVGVVLLWEGKC